LSVIITNTHYLDSRLRPPEVEQVRMTL